MTEAKKTTETKKIDPKALSEVSNRVELGSIRLESLATKFEQAPGADVSAILLEFEYDCGWRRRDERPGFDVRFVFESSLCRMLTGDAVEGKFFEFKAIYVLEYVLGEPAPNDWDERLDMFSSVNGVINIWPYVRAELASVFSKMGLPQLMLPVYRPGRPNTGRVEFRAS
ncbi:hypothetical protein P2318_33435 [Myxococcaceae bacterium GXIMD 01537]